ncbi:MAG: hypothetical protein WD512_19595 [Candidatus Paceibacterota bacterium]
MLTLEMIYEDFRDCDTYARKISYLIELRKMNLSYDINYDALIANWRAVEKTEKKSTEE